jgi:hypothetical protein
MNLNETSIYTYIEKINEYYLSLFHYGTIVFTPGQFLKITQLGIPFLFCFLSDIITGYLDFFTLTKSSILAVVIHIIDPTAAFVKQLVYYALANKRISCLHRIGDFIAVTSGFTSSSQMIMNVLKDMLNRSITFITFIHVQRSILSYNHLSNDCVVSAISGLP